MTSTHFKLKNGIRTHLIPFDSTDAATILVLCKVGSRYETPAISGASHFIEHMMFKGTKRRPATLDISRALDAVGAEYNAYTGKDLTGYYVKVDSPHVGLAIDVLHDMLFHSVYAKPEMDRERKVIMEEINMYEDNPIMYVEELLEQSLFAGSPLGWEIAGSHATMRAMKRQDVLAYRDTYYVPSRLVIAASGKLPQDVRSRLEATFGTVKEGKTSPAEFEPFSALPVFRAPRVRVRHQKTQQVQLAFGFPSYGIADERNLVAKMLGIILGGTMSSRLFVAVREKRGLAYSVRASQSYYEDVGNFTIQAGLDKSRLPLALRTLFQELRLVKRLGVKPAELRLAQSYISGKLKLKFEDSSYRAEYVGRQEVFKGSVETPEEYLRKIEKITPTQVHQVARDILDGGRLHVACIGPYRTPVAFLKQSALPTL